MRTNLSNERCEPRLHFCQGECGAERLNEVNECERQVGPEPLYEHELVDLQLVGAPRVPRALGTTAPSARRRQAIPYNYVLIRNPN